MYDAIHDIGVKIYEPDGYEPWGEIQSYAYPDGSVKNSLDADEMREVAELIEEMADELKDIEEVQR